MPANVLLASEKDGLGWAGWASITVVLQGKVSRFTIRIMFGF